jgi:hypothetical protein
VFRIRASQALQENDSRRALEKLHTVNAEKDSSLHWSDEFPAAVGNKAGQEKVEVETLRQL